jgi:outer membrane lipoprotein-sorting protein
MVLLMKTKVILPILVAMSAFLGTSAQADEIQFTTLPQPVQTTVIRETHISGPSSVLRILKDENGIYAITVREETGEQVVYVNGSGAIVQTPATTTIQRTQPATETQQTIITYDEIQADQSRYELLKKEHDKEVYLDHQTGQKVTVKHKD